jgi:pimeloyl-ACP methyl ester carboxylesterase
MVTPTAHGGKAEDAFHLVLPSLPGYGFSGKPAAPGWDRHRIARAWHTLMTRLGYTRYVAQGGDWGAVVTQAMGHQAPNGLAGIHINMPAVGVTVFPGEIYRAPRSWAQRTYHRLVYWNEVDSGGHFAAFEQPEIFTREVRAAFAGLTR